LLVKAGLSECNSPARAIHKTALRAYCGCRRCFTHWQASDGWTVATGQII